MCANYAVCFIVSVVLWVTDSVCGKVLQRIEYMHRGIV